MSIDSKWYDFYKNFLLNKYSNRVSEAHICVECISKIQINLSVRNFFKFTSWNYHNYTESLFIDSLLHKYSEHKECCPQTFNFILTLKLQNVFENFNSG